MNKGIFIVLAILLLISAGCAKKVERITGTEGQTGQTITTEDASVNQLGSSISDTSDVEQDLDSSKLNDIDSTLADIEKI